MSIKYLVDGFDKDQKRFFSDSFASYDAAKNHTDEMETDFDVVIIRRVETEEIYRTETDD